MFISHSFETDHELALRLAADLATDADVWLAPESIAPGESWLSSVERGLTASRVVLALLSKASLASPWVLKEIQAAMELEIHSRLRLVPVEVEECDVPILLRTYQTLRLAMGYRELVEQTRRLVERARLTGRVGLEPAVWSDGRWRAIGHDDGHGNVPRPSL